MQNLPLPVFGGSGSNVVLYVAPNFSQISNMGTSIPTNHSNKKYLKVSESDKP